MSAYDAAADIVARSLCHDEDAWYDYEDQYREDGYHALDTLLVAREHTTCPTCGGRGGGPEWPQDDSWCRSCDGSGSVPGGSLLLAVMVEKGLLQDEKHHVVQFDEDGWTLQHPLSERLDGSLFDCNFNTACHEMDGPPEEGPGRYKATLGPNGGLVLVFVAGEGTP